MSDERKKVLEQVAQLAEREAKAHDDGCVIGDAFKKIASAVREEANGPAQVATPAYRNGWENVFGQKMPIGQA